MSPYPQLANFDMPGGYLPVCRRDRSNTALQSLNLLNDPVFFECARALEPKFHDAVHTLKGAPHVLDIRSVGLAAAIEMEGIPDAPGKRGYQALQTAFFDQSLVMRISGDTIVLIPALIASESEITRMVDGVRAVLSALD